MSVKEDKWYLINETTLMNQGRIFANPFEVKFEVLPATLWLLEHREWSERIIQSIFNRAFVSRLGCNVSDCYAYILNQFLFHTTNVKTPIDEGMSLAAYCTAQIRLHTLEYLKAYRKEPTPLAILNSEERKSVSGVLIDNLKSDNTATLPIDRDSWASTDLLFYDLCELYKPFLFEDLGFPPFDTEKYFTYLYFSIKSENLEEQLKYAASKVGISVSKISFFTAKIREAVLKKSPQAEDILSMIRELLREKELTGWKPPLLRKEEGTK